MHSESQLQAMLRDRLNLRIGPEVLKYLSRRLAASSSSSSGAFPIMGADARTGAPMKLLIDPRELVANDSANSSVSTPSSGLL